MSTGKLEISQDEKTFEQLKHVFSVHASYVNKKGQDVYSQNCYTTTDINNLHRYIVQTNIVKEKRDLICFQPHYKNTKINDDCELPIMCMVDIDVKPLDRVEANKKANQDKMNKQFILDMGCIDLFKASDNCYNMLKNDACCVYVDKSNSGTGIKALFAITSEKYTDLKNSGITSKTQILEEFDTQLQKHTGEKTMMLKTIIENNKEEAKRALTEGKTLMGYNFKALTQYLSSKYNINFYSDNSKPNYFDKAGESISQCTYSSNGTHLHINKDAKILKWDFTDKTQHAEYKEKTNKINTGVDGVLALKENDEYLELFFKFYAQLKKDKADNKKGAIEKHAKIQSIMGNYLVCYRSALPVINSLRCSTLKYQEIFFNEFLYQDNNLYKGGGSLNTSCFKDFLVSISNIDMDDKVLLSELMIGCYRLKKKDIDTTILPYSNSYDFFGNKYDTIIKFTKYVSKKKVQLFNIFDNNKLVVLSAEAGGGKSYLLREYMKYRFDKGATRIALVIPKNSLLFQNKEIIESYKNKGYQIIQNYGVGDKYDSTKYDENEKLLILTSTPKIRHLDDVDLIIHDEIQNYVSYSGKIESNIDVDCQQIMISATPEKFLIYVKDYFYVRLQKYDAKKKTIKLQYISGLNDDLDKLIDKDRKQMFFFNDKKKCADIKEHYSSKGIDFQLLNSDTANDKNVKIDLAKQELQFTHYLGTSFILDGLNFDNEKWHDLTIICDSIDVFEIYQMCYRFRNARHLNIRILVHERKDTFQNKIGFYQFKYYAKYEADLQEVNECLNGLNNSMLTKDNLKISENDNGIIEQENGKLLFNRDYLKLSIYNKVYNDYYKRYQDVMIDSLNWYFNIEYVNKVADEKEGEKLSFRFDKEVNKVFTEHSYSIIKMCETIDILSFKDKTVICGLMEIYNNDNDFESSISNKKESKFNDKTFNYIIDNAIEFRGCYERYKDILSKSIRNGKTIDISTTNALKMAVSSTRVYNAQVTKLNKNHLGGITNCKDAHVTDKHAHKAQSRMIKIIKDNDFILNIESNGFVYHTVNYDRLLMYLIKNKDEYVLFKKVNLDYYFKLSLKDLKKYCNGINRAFYTKQLKVPITNVKRPYYTIVSNMGKAT